MRKTLFALLLVGVFGFAGVRPALAQSDAALVKVSFPFIAGQKVLPAGSYRISADARDSSLLLIASTSVATDAAFVATGSTEIADAMGSQVHVAFKNVDGHYFLWKIAMPDGSARQINVTKVEADRTLARLNLMPVERGDSAK
jgi:hypothetical protein